MTTAIRLTAMCSLVLASVCCHAIGEDGSQPRGSGVTQPDKRMLDYYRTHSEWTNPGEHKTMFRGIPDDISSIVKSVQGCLIHGGLVWLYDLKPSEAQGMGFNIRRTDELLRRIAAFDESPLSVPRPKEKRLLVNCRQFSVLTCSILRHKGVPARVRTGYALYTWGRGMHENHWICECWSSQDRRWIRIDAQIDTKQKALMRIDFNTLDMPEGRFISAGEGWRRYSDGTVKLDAFGLGGRDGWNALGWDMVMPNVTTDLMALNKTELLPWDVNPHWRKTKQQMSTADMETIEKAALLSRQVDASWAEMRRFYQKHPALRMPEGFDTKERTAEQVSPPHADKPRR